MLIFGLGNIRKKLNFNGILLENPPYPVSYLEIIEIIFKFKSKSFQTKQEFGMPENRDILDTVSISDARTDK